MGKKVILTIHSYKPENSFVPIIDRWVYSMPNATIVVGIEINQKLKLKNKVHSERCISSPVLENEVPVPVKFLTG